MSDVIFAPKFNVQSSYLADYFGTWMMDENVMRSLIAKIDGMDLRMHMQSQDSMDRVQSRNSRLYEVDAYGIATFVIDGAMMKSVPSMADGSSYALIRQQVQSAKRDPEVRGGLILMDTPGGTARGNEDVVMAVRSFAKEKPIYAFVEDMTCSAGVSIASQATKRYANNATAMYGSMGTYLAVQDVSGMAEKIGLKVHVLKAGEYKGSGTPGTEITDTQLAEWQRIVDALNENYLGLIASGLGRSIDSIRPLADGRVIFASDAVSQGLLDDVQTVEQTIEELRGMVSRKPVSSLPNRRNTMATEKTTATLQELKTTFPNSTADWRETQMEAGNDLSSAAIDYARFVESNAAAERAAFETKLAEAQKASTKPTSSLGHQPLTTSNVSDAHGIDTGDAVQDFHEAVRARCPRNRQASYGERQAAVAFVARTRPELHQAYIASCNAGSRVQRLIKEKYENASAN